MALTNEMKQKVFLEMEKLMDKAREMRKEHKVGLGESAVGYCFVNLAEGFGYVPKGERAARHCFVKVTR